MTTPKASTGGTLLSVNVGMPHDVQWQAGRTVHTGIGKYPVGGTVMVRRLNVDGDGQGDKAGHGGEQRAVMLYQVESYRYWERQLGLASLEYGAFGENLTVTGMPDDQVCVGDRYRVGEATLEVTQPRVTCFRVGVRLDQPLMPGLLVAHRRPRLLPPPDSGGARMCPRHAQAHVPRAARPHGRGGGRPALSAGSGHRPRPGPPSDVPALSPGWRQSFAEILFSRTRAGMMPPGIEVGEPGWPGFRPLTVTRLEHETDQVLSIELDAEEHGALPTPLPGQYLTLQVVSASDAMPVCPYSICAVTGSGGYRIAVKREQGGLVSSWLHGHLRVGDTLQETVREACSRWTVHPTTRSC